MSVNFHNLPNTNEDAVAVMANAVFVITPRPLAPTTVLTLGQGGVVGIHLFMGYNQEILYVFNVAWVELRT